MKAKLYLHSSKDSNYEIGKELGLPEGKVLDNFMYALYEVGFDVEIDETTGDCKILKVNGDDIISGDMSAILIKSMTWMVTQLKWQFDNERDALCDQGSQGGYSPLLTEAMEILKELEK